MAITAGDLFSKWILDQVGLSAQTSIEAAFFYMAAIQTQPLLVIIMGTIIVLAQIIQFFMMVGRNAMIVVLVGQMPLAASGSNTDMGQQWTQKAIAWLIALRTFTSLKGAFVRFMMSTFTSASGRENARSTRAPSGR